MRQASIKNPQQMYAINENYLFNQLLRITIASTQNHKIKDPKVESTYDIFCLAALRPPHPPTDTPWILD